MRQLYFARSGESTASHFSIWAPYDTPLTDLGRWQAQAAGCDARQHGLEFDLILSLPHKHSHETAQLIAGELDYNTRKIVLLDDFDAKNETELAEQAAELFNLLQKQREQRVLIVGHNELGQALFKTSNAAVNIDSEKQDAEPLPHAHIMQIHPLR